MNIRAWRAIQRVSNCGNREFPQEFLLPVGGLEPSSNPSGGHFNLETTFRIP